MDNEKEKHYYCLGEKEKCIEDKEGRGMRGQGERMTQGKDMDTKSGRHTGKKRTKTIKGKQIRLMKPS